MSRLLKIFLLLAVFSLAVLFTPQPATASQFIDAITSPDMNLQKFTIGEDIVKANGVPGMTSTLMEALVVMTVGAKDENGNIISQGATGDLFALMDQMNQRPVVSSKDYLAYYGQRLNLAAPAYAQGQGFDFIHPIIGIWTISRNIVYLLFVVIFVTIGFMIMFRSKLNPQTAINIQLALPNIIISLILVTFSFALCGFIIDIAYLGNGLIDKVFKDELRAIITAAGSPAGGVFWADDATPIKLISHTGLSTTLLTALGAMRDLAGSGPALLLNLVIAITLLSVSFKIFFNMLTAYVALLLVTIISPFSLLIGAIPGGQSPFTIFKQILAQSLVFPATYFLTNLALFFSKYADITTVGFKNIIPFPITTFLSDNPNIAMASLASLLALGVLMTATQVPQIISQALKAESPLGAGTGEQVGGALRKLPIIGGLIG